MSSDLVSVVIPTYNAAAYVGAAVESVLRQTYTNLEVIVIDDGSIDNTRVQLESYRDRIQYVFQRNRGVSAARNAGIRRAAGEWVAFLDADDLWHAQKTEVQLKAIAPFADAAAVGAPMLPWPPQTPDAASALAADPPVRRLCARDFLFATMFGPSSAMVRRKCFDEVGCFDESLSGVADREMWLRLATRLPVYQVLAPCWWYRRHTEQMSGNVRGMLADYRRLLSGFFHEHREYRGLRRLAYGRMYMDVAYSFYEQGAAFQAIWRLLQSYAWYQRPVSDRGRFFRSKLLAKFVLGQRAIHTAKRALVSRC